VWAFQTPQVCNTSNLRVLYAEPTQRNIFGGEFVFPVEGNMRNLRHRDRKLRYSIMRRILTISLFSLALMLIAACNFSFTGNLPATIVADISATDVPLGQPTWTRIPGSTPTRVANNPTAVATVVAPTAVVPNCTPRNDWPVYTVQPGDTLGNIAARTNSSVNALAGANCLTNVNTIFSGQLLRVPFIPAPPTTVPVPYEIGFVSINPFVATEGGGMQLQSGTTVTVAWPEAPRNAFVVDFVLLDPSNHNNVTSIGRDNYPADGSVITWQVPTTLNALVMAYAVRNDYYRIAQSGTNYVYATGNCVVRQDWIPYTVQLGDTLSSIAARVGLQPGELFQANCLVPPGNLNIGQQIRVPYLPGPFPTVCPPVTTQAGVGVITVAPYLAFENNCYQLSPGETVTVSWPEAPANFEEVTFYFLSTAPNADPDVIGVDNDPSNGAAINFEVYPTEYVGTLYAFGYSQATGMLTSGSIGMFAP
jgi:LysM repeat protein